MKSIQIPRTVAGLAAAFLFQTGSLQAGFSSERLGITHVPIGGEEATKEGLEFAERSEVPYFEMTKPLSAAEVTQLQAHKQFKDLSSAEVQAKIVEIRRAIICAIYFLRKSDPAKANGLERLYAAGMISVGIAPEGYNVNSAIRDDGKKEFNLEPINLYNPPCGDSFDGGLADQFELINDLANLAFYAGNETQGPRDGTAFEAELATQCRQLEAAEGELERISQMEAVINGIKTSGDVPPGTKGMYRSIGFFLGGLSIFNPAKFSEAMADWENKLKLMRHKAQFRKDHWTTKKRETELRIAGHAASGNLRAGLRQQGVFEDFGRNSLNGTIERYYANEIGGIDETGAVPMVSWNNRLTQFVPGMSSPESFPVNDLDTICAGYVWEEEMKAFIGGIKFGTGGAEDQGRVVTFDLDANYRIRPETARLSFGTPEMKLGYTMSLNPDDGKFYAMQPSTGVVCVFEDTDDDKEPDYAQFAGQFSTGSLSIKPDLGYFFFPQGDTGVAQEHRPESPLGFNDRLALTWRDHTTDFMPQPEEEFLDSLCQRPGFDGLVGVGDQYLPLSGTPYSNFNLYDRGMMIAHGCFSPHGFANPHLTTPLSEDSELWINDEKTGFESVRLRPKYSFGDIPKVEIEDEDRDFDISVGIRYEISPKLSFRLEYGNSLDSVDENSVSPGFTSRAGVGFMTVPGNGSPMRFFRGLGEPYSGINPQPDNFEITPGLLNYFDVSKNDDAPPSARYELVEPPTVFGTPFTDTGFKFFPDGTFYVGFPTFAGSISFKYRLCVGDYISPDVLVFIAAFGGQNVINEPEDAGQDVLGRPLVEALFLEVGGLYYPLYQFRMGPPEPITMTSGCLTIHWHGGPAYPIEDPFALPIVDLLPTRCGFGTIEELPVRSAILLKEDWDFFKTIHP